MLTQSGSETAAHESEADDRDLHGRLPAEGPAADHDEPLDIRDERGELGRRDLLRGIGESVLGRRMRFDDQGNLLRIENE